MDESELPLTRQERRIAGGDRRRRWFIALFLIAGVLGLLGAARVHGMCQMPDVYCAGSDATGYSGYEVMIDFAGFGTLAIIVAVVNMFRRDRSGDALYTIG